MSIFNKIFKGNTLYYPGCLTKFVLKDIQENYKKILEKEGIDFIMLKEKELCCGSPLKNSGDQERFKDVAQKNLKVFKEHGVDRIITNCPACALVLKKDYKTLLGDQWEIQVEHVTEIIKAVPGSDLSQQPKKKVTYHDSCHLGRELGIFDQPRKIIQKKSYEIEEMTLTREKSFCCGGGGGVRSNNNELASRIAKDRLDQAKQTQAGLLITACPMCYANLKANSEGMERYR